ncbi:MAG TPA: GTPase Era [Longimicrobiales bacterium]|nr:GTPase Era [Longimicrobiales bacterium]
MTQPADSGGSAVETRAGYVALVGRPNVGKSTLLNALTGERLSIVTPWAQTTRDRVSGIYTDESVQIIFVDTPGLLEPRYLLQRSMLDTALRALEESDLVVLLLDATRPGELPGEDVLGALRARRSALFVAVNKIDAGTERGVRELEEWTQEVLGMAPRRMSAATGTGVDQLRADLAAALPRSPFYYPPDDVAIQPLRFFAAEFIRETVFEEYSEEVPYATVVRVDEFREASDPVYIRATVYVERPSQKAILVGRGGAAIRRLGERARAKLETLIGARVYLDLWVKTLPGWRRKRGTLRFLGYPVPEEPMTRQPGKPNAG